MGESWDDRASMLQVLANLSPQPESVPINALVPVDGTPLQNQKPVEPIEMISFYTYFESDPENVEIIKKKIDEVFEEIKNKKFDQNIIVDQKKMLINEFKENLRTNGYWQTLMEYSDIYNLDLERFMNIELIIESITINDISRLAKKYLDDKYVRDIHLTSE